MGWLNFTIFWAYSKLLKQFWTLIFFPLVSQSLPFPSHPESSLAWCRAQSAFLKWINTVRTVVLETPYYWVYLLLVIYYIFTYIDLLFHYILLLLNPCIDVLFFFCVFQRFGSMQKQILTKKWIRNILSCLESFFYLKLSPWNRLIKSSFLAVTRWRVTKNVTPTWGSAQCV